MTDFSIIGRAGTCVTIMIVMDVVAGVTSAASRGELDSTKLRRGLFHKLALILAFALGVALEFIEGALGIGLDIPLVVPVSTYIILMEACSVYENLKLMNPEFKFESFEELFKFNEKEKEHDESKIQGDDR